MEIKTFLAGLLLGLLVGFEVRWTPDDLRAWLTSFFRKIFGG